MRNLLVLFMILPTACRSRNLQETTVEVGNSQSSLPNQAANEQQKASKKTTAPQNDLQLFPLGEGSGLVGINPQFMESAEAQPGETNSLGLVDLSIEVDDSVFTVLTTAGAVAGAAVVSAGVYKAGSKIANSDKVKGIRIQAGFEDFDVETKAANFRRKGAINMKEYIKDKNSAFTEIKLSANQHDQNSGKVFLGIMPDDEILASAKQRGGKRISVLSVVEDFELKTPFEYKEKLKDGTVVTKTFKAFNSASVDGAFEKIETPDYRPVEGDLLHKGAEFIHRQVTAGNNIYVHCKSGKGRSAAMVAAYLIKYKGLSAEQAIQLIKKQRPKVSIAKFDFWGLANNHHTALTNFAASLSP